MCGNGNPYLTLEAEPPLLQADPLILEADPVSWRQTPLSLLSWTQSPLLLEANPYPLSFRGRPPVDRQTLLKTLPSLVVSTHKIKQECIPVGCILLTHYHTGGFILGDLCLVGSLSSRGLCPGGCLCLIPSLARRISVFGGSP